MRRLIVREWEGREDELTPELASALVRMTFPDELDVIETQLQDPVCAGRFNRLVLNSE
jgi:hypothetical protein